MDVTETSAVGPNAEPRERHAIGRPKRPSDRDGDRPDRANARVATIGPCQQLRHRAADDDDEKEPCEALDQLHRYQHNTRGCGGLTLLTH